MSEAMRYLGIKQLFTSYNNLKKSSSTERDFRMYKEEVVWSVEEISYSELIIKTEEYE